MTFDDPAARGRAEAPSPHPERPAATDLPMGPAPVDAPPVDATSVVEPAAGDPAAEHVADRPSPAGPGFMPPFLVGISAAVAAEVAAGMLLYGGPGLARSVTTVLAVEAAALAAGLAAPAPHPGERGQLRGRWLLALTAFLVAASFATVWAVVPSLGSGRLGQGLGLAVLAALPLYACGALLGGFTAERTAAAVVRRRLPRRRSRIAPVAALGAATGFLATGVLLPRAPMPASLMVGCLVLLSLGAMVHTTEGGVPSP